MVKKDICVYLLAGQDSSSKDKVLAKIKQDFLKRESREFNLDILYARELALGLLQERLLLLPLKSGQRIVVIRNAQELKEEVREFILGYVKKPQDKVILVLDADRYEPKDNFFNSLGRRARLIRFNEPQYPNTFSLSRQIGSRRLAASLRILNQLLENGEKPERILGGLRYAWERDIADPLEKRKRFKFLLACDSDIKTGRLKPAFALERLLIGLCGFKNPSRKP